MCVIIYMTALNQSLYSKKVIFGLYHSKKMDLESVMAHGVMKNSEFPPTDYNAVLQNLGRHSKQSDFVVLFDYFAPRIKSFLMKGNMSEDQAEELAQETMLSVWYKAHTYDINKAAASTWIFTIARNKKIDLLRKGKHYTVDSDDPLYAIEDPEASATDTMIRNQSDEIVKQAMDALPEAQAAMIRKSFYEDKSHSVIAEEENIPLGTVKSRIRLAIERLKREIDQKGAVL